MTADCRGQSEVLGFIFVFAIVVLFVGLLTTVGYGQLRAVQTHEQVNSAERSFERLSETGASLVRGRAPGGEVELELGGGSISTGEPINLTVSGEAVGAPSQNFSRSFDVRPLVYEMAGTEIRYVGGAVIRVDEGAIMVREPPAVLSSEQTVLPVISTRLRSGGIGGRSTVVARIDRPENGSRLVRANTTAHDLEIVIRSPRAEVWERYLERTLGISCSRARSTLSCSFTSERLYLLRVDLTVTVDR